MSARSFYRTGYRHLLGLGELSESHSWWWESPPCHLGNLTTRGHLPNDQTPASCLLPLGGEGLHLACLPPSSSPSIIVLICVRSLAKIQGAHAMRTPPRHTDVLELERLHDLVQLPHFSWEIYGPERPDPPHIKHLLRACVVPGPER